MASVTDRRDLHLKAVWAQRKGMNPDQFRAWLAMNWPTGLDRIPERELTAFIVVVWG